MIPDIQYLGIALPENIFLAKSAGDFEKAYRLIDSMLQDSKVPEAMKKRLILEKEVLHRLPKEYPYTEQEALMHVQKEIPDFTKEELQEWMDKRVIDWIYVNHEVRIRTNFFETMKKVYPEIEERAGIHADHFHNQLLYENIASMKKNGRTVWHIHLKTTLQIKDSSFEKDRKVLVHLPVPVSSINMKNIHILSSSDHSSISSESGPARTISFFETMQENHPFFVEYEYDSEVNYNNPDPSLVKECQESRYLNELEPHILFTPLIRHLCSELKGTETNPLKIAEKFYHFVTENVTYSFMRPYFLLPEIPDYCISELKGDCGVQALTFITLCRCAGIPARWQSGLYVTPDHVGNHDWAMYYIEPYGWLFADCSFGGSAYRAGNKEGQEYYMHNLDPFRMAANSAFQADLIPEKKYYRIDPYDNQSGEVEYEDRGLESKEFETTYELKEIRKLV